MIRTHRITPFAKALHLARFLERWLATPDHRDPAPVFDRLLRSVDSPVMTDAERCYFINRARSCGALHRAGEFKVALYQMRELVKKLHTLHRAWFTAMPVRRPVRCMVSA